MANDKNSDHGAQGFGTRVREAGGLVGGDDFLGGAHIGVEERYAGNRPKRCFHSRKTADSGFEKPVANDFLGNTCHRLAFD